jgi:hypothetical protein
MMGRSAACASVLWSNVRPVGADPLKRCCRREHLEVKKEPLKKET